MLSNKVKNFNLILASGSPRRQLFFKDLNLDFEIKIKEIKEVYPKHLLASEITDYLANLKATPFLNELKENDLLITSDTIVWFENEALGKPKDYKEAFNMLKRMSGKTHTVITSVSIKNINFQKIFNDSTTVTFKELTDEEINYYLEHYKPYDKAGSYGIQEWIGKIAITSINGSYFNVMGLPIHKLYEELMNL